MRLISILILLVTSSTIVAFPLGYRTVPLFQRNSIAQKPKYCLGMAIQGGSSKGAFQAGAIQSFVKNLPFNETQYTSVTGVSIGAINSFGISVQKLDTPKIYQFVSQMWHHIAIDQMMISWKYGMIEGLLWHSSLFDYKFSDYIISHYAQQFPKIERALTVGAVNLRTGKFQLFNSTLGFEGMALAIQASSSIPFVFPPTKIKDQYYIDGGSVYNVLPAQAITQCVNMGYSIEDTKVDVLMTNPFNITRKDMSLDKDGGLINMLSRVNQIKSHYQSVFEVLNSMWEYPNAKWRYFVRPASELDQGANFVDFSQKHIDQIYQEGIDTGKKVVDMGEGTSFEKFLQGEGKVINYGTQSRVVNESQRIKFMRQKVVYM